MMIDILSDRMLSKVNLMVESVNYGKDLNLVLVCKNDFNIWISRCEIQLCFLCMIDTPYVKICSTVLLHKMLFLF
jgi:hypothetical protein